MRLIKLLAASAFLAICLSSTLHVHHEFKRLYPPPIPGEIDWKRLGLLGIPQGKARPPIPRTILKDQAKYFSQFIKENKDELLETLRLIDERRSAAYYYPDHL